MREAAGMMDANAYLSRILKNLPYLEAQASGKIVQRRAGFSGESKHAYVDVTRPIDVYSDSFFRIKPEPDIMYVNVYKTSSTGYRFANEAKHYASENALEVAKPYIAMEDKGCAGECVCGHNCQ